MKVRLKLNSKLRAKYTEWSYKEIYMALSHRTALPGRTGDLIFFSAAVSPSLTDLFPTLLMGLSAFFLCFLLLSAFFLHCSTTDWMLFPPPVWALLYRECKRLIPSQIQVLALRAAIKGVKPIHMYRARAPGGARQPGSVQESGAGGEIVQERRRRLST